MADIFDDKAEMPAARNSIAVGANLMSPDFAAQRERMPGAPYDKDLSVKNIEPRKRGCHY